MSPAYGVPGQSSPQNPYSTIGGPYASMDTSQTLHSPMNNPYQQQITPTSMKPSISEYLRSSPISSPPLTAMSYQQAQPSSIPTSAQQSSNPFHPSYSTPGPSTASPSSLSAPYYSSNVGIADYPAPTSSNTHTSSPDPFASLASSILPSFGMSSSTPSSQNRSISSNHPQNPLSGPPFPQPHTTPPNQTKLDISNPHQSPSPSHLIHFDLFEWKESK